MSFLTQGTSLRASATEVPATAFRPRVLMHKLTDPPSVNENAHHWWCSGSYHCFGRWLGFYPTGFRRGTQLCDCRWPERRRGPGCKRPAPAAPRFRKRRFLTNVNALTVVAAAATFASVAIAQDARVRADRLENDIANGVQTNGVYPAQSRTIWRSPEITPRTWEEQRVAG